MITIHCGNCKRQREAEEIVPYARYRCKFCNSVNEVVNVRIREWIGFDFEEYLNEIREVIKKDGFTMLAAESITDTSLGYLSQSQVKRLKKVLVDNFEKGASIRDIRDDVLTKVKPKNLKVLDDDGNVRFEIPKEERALSIARTETTRVSNLGAQEHYRKAEVKEVSWVASVSARTCPQCEALNGQIFLINRGPRPPLHPLCRCTIIPRVELL